MNDSDMIERHDRLLREFRIAMKPNSVSRNSDRQPFQKLLADFGVISAQAVDEEANRARKLLTFADGLLRDFRSALERWRVSQEQTADDFNMLGVMQVIERETIHSRVLAWLLSSDMNHLGTHAQGPLVFRIFLAEVELPQSYANDDNHYWVRTEVRGDESIIDVEVACKGKFLIHIENKIGALEGENQTSREWSDLVSRAAYLNIHEDRTHAYFLTVDGTQPKEQGFKPINWFKIANVFERFAEEAKPPEVRVFSSHYARSMRLISGQKTRSAEVADGEADI